MEHRDDIDRWLYENVGVIPGCCSSIDSLKYNVAREVAEKLWGAVEISRRESPKTTPPVSLAREVILGVKTDKNND